METELNNKPYICFIKKLVKYISHDYQNNKYLSRQNGFAPLGPLFSHGNKNIIFPVIFQSLMIAAFYV